MFYFSLELLNLTTMCLADISFMILESIFGLCDPNHTNVEKNIFMSSNLCFKIFYQINYKLSNMWHLTSTWSI